MITTVARRASATETIRGSRFLAMVARIDGPAGATALVDGARRAHPGASHHCSAWRAGREMGSDDDGEPAGTAGRPMLEVLLKRDLDQVATVCVRWFGGTKLGAGGLVRAYGGTVAKALDEAGTRIVHATVAATVAAPYARADAVHRLLDGWDELVKGEPAYDADGLSLPVVLRMDRADALARSLADATAGDAELRLDASDDAGSDATGSDARGNDAKGRREPDANDA